jgi:hypothetical protein
MIATEKIPVKARCAAVGVAVAVVLNAGRTRSVLSASLAHQLLSQYGSTLGETLAISAADAIFGHIEAIGEDGFIALVHAIGSTIE